MDNYIICNKCIDKLTRSLPEVLFLRRTIVAPNMILAF